MSRVKRFLLYSILIGLMFSAAACYYIFRPISFIPMQQSFVIETGQTGSQVAYMLEQKELVKQPLWFLLLVRITGKTNKIKAGNYEVTSPISLYQLLVKITDGDVEAAKFIIIEGTNWKKIRQALLHAPDLRHELATYSNQEVLAAIGATENHLEGLFFPDTYHYVKGSSDIDILRRAYTRLQRILQQTWQTRVVDVPLKSPYELLILASIVEKETGYIADRELIAGVFVNRLRMGMRLQTDPTVIYGMGDQYRGKIRKVDLLTDTLYNTYTRAGLPPSPIAMPGLAALTAAANPAKTRALYFVAKRNGRSHFSETLEEHNRAVNFYIRGVNR